MIKAASPAAARFPLQVQAVLQQGLALRDRYNHQKSLCTAYSLRPDGWK